MNIKPTFAHIAYKFQSMLIVFLNVFLALKINKVFDFKAKCKYELVELTPRVKLKQNACYKLNIQPPQEAMSAFSHLKAPRQ